MVNRQLWNYHVELNKISQSAIFFLLRSRINDFYKEYGIRIDTLNNKIKAIEKTYFLHEGDKLQMSAPTEKEASSPILNEGKTHDDFNKEINELLDSNIISSPLIKLK